MKAHKLGYIISGFGIFLVLFGLLSDRIGIGKGGIQAAQLLLIQVGALLVAASIGFFYLPSPEIDFPRIARQMLDRILNLPASIWILLGFTAAYILFFVFPVFLNPNHQVDYVTRYLPEIRPIGRDLAFNTSSIKNWLSGKGLYDLDMHYYPPLYAVVFSPFLLLKYPTTYYVMTAITILCMAVSSIIIPQLMSKDNDRAILFLFFITGLFSYGMQFELERGQFNVFAFTLALLAVYIFHYQYSFRHLAYLLFSISIQIKLYPAIFILMFVKDWRDWQNNILRFIGLGLANIALLFVLGYQVFADFLRVLPNLTSAVWVRPYNHSLASFVNDLTSSGLGILNADALKWFGENSSLVKVALVVYYAVCLLAILARAYKKQGNAINFDLLLACAIGALIIPSVSIDYKLPLLSPVFAMALSYTSPQISKARKALSIILLTATSLVYAMMLFPFTYRPALISSCFLLLMFTLTTITLLNLIEDRVYNRTVDSELVKE